QLHYKTRCFVHQTSLLAGATRIIRRRPGEANDDMIPRINPRESCRLLRGGLTVRFNKTAFALLLTLLITGVAVGQKQDKSLGGIKGKVRVETGTPSG